MFIPDWVKSVSVVVVGGAILAVLAGAANLYDEVKANTAHNTHDETYNIRVDSMSDTLIRIDENVKFMKEQLKEK